MPDSLELEVVNRTGAGSGTSPGAFPTSGHGLPGPLERVRLLNSCPHDRLTSERSGHDRLRRERSGLRTLLAMQPGIVVVGEAADDIEAVERARQLRPDVVLMDVRMPRCNGIEATRQLLAGPADPAKVVVITTFENDDYVTAALSAGAGGFVLKRLPVPKIAEAVRVVAAGEAILFPAALRQMVTARPRGSAEALRRAEPDPRGGDRVRNRPGRARGHGDARGYSA